MTKDAMRLAMSVPLGWELCRDRAAMICLHFDTGMSAEWVRFVESPVWYRVNDPDPMLQALPNWPGDLNAIHEALLTLSRSEQEMFGCFIYSGQIGSFQDFCTGKMVWQFVTKEPLELALGYCRVKGIYVEDEP